MVATACMDIEAIFEDDTKVEQTWGERHCFDLVGCEVARDMAMKSVYRDTGVETAYSELKMTEHRVRVTKMWINLIIVFGKEHRAKNTKDYDAGRED